jgi:Protein of unknown function (DUF1552)
MVLTGKRLSRRTALKGIGATIALPLLDAMTPAGAAASAARRPLRLVCIEIVHGCAGSSTFGAREHLWAPAAAGSEFDLSRSSLRPLEPFRDQLTIVSNCDVANADPADAQEIGGDHWRSSAAFLTQSHPLQTTGAGVRAGTSLDQVYAQRVGGETPIPSVQLCIEAIDQSGGCGYGYSCVYADTISWSSPTRPLPMIRDPRVVFDTLFGALRSDEPREVRRRHLAEDRSILDRLLESSTKLKNALGPRDRVRIDDYLEQVREIERRIQAAEQFARSGELRELPEAPAGVPDSFTEHVRLMFDLQLAAFASDVTRVVAFKLARDNSNRPYPESGCPAPFHPASHHGGKEHKIRQLAMINTYHVSTVVPFLERLRDTRDGEGTLLDGTVLVYGSPMGDPNQHNHKRVPFVIVGRAHRAIAGGRHIKAANATPLADAMLGLLHAMGCGDIASFGDSERAMDLS